MTIKLIVGLGNPGKDYQSNRHNAGFWLCEALAHLYAGNFKKETKFFGEVAQINISGRKVRLLKPTVFMNCSGQSIQSIVNFYQINTNEILIVHDELDIDPGIAKIKFDGGHGGHNGLRDTIQTLGTKAFHRLRIGIGHPGDKSQVTNFVLHAPSKGELEKIQNSLNNSLQIIEDMINGNFDKAIKTLHTKE
ncbi:peptidyl-tRNA hydrolase [Candidatus Ruthia magnifica str. Cm (Calyptogena magnifica)]|uniref:Peptidyl-tRNA hydrolase n=1 Tax=Ruthia magnifica subsp. Calyptogena magnifica TaxID=413404 RepID=PTH_RUTMC|nr:aminoacyl-tRNA hydrolase [Candidatus Ruthturnera calyptogenae]A1AXW5.1 RecName: Full=Peptidyl-tRNA hydrolase; Short=PTH [Candidatus Ruthia magnifica str. Cm (Calyptogena magnifica)]ABL02772.1 peptidyl-tRNA hydrolase [Candidatus Ruthia magnifica str. Cm (Calyptogena magnifica)]